MRKWLTLIGIIVVILGAISFWLASKAADGRPEPGEVRLQIEDAI
ncbi:MAG: hypothetical protein ABJG15_17665 [Hyphomonadaceae bacterium]